MSNEGGGGEKPRPGDPGGKPRAGRGRDLDIGDFEGGGAGISIELDAGPASHPQPSHPQPSHPEPPPSHPQYPQAPPPGPSSSGMLAHPPPSLSSGQFPEAAPSQGQLLIAPPPPPPRPAPPPKPRRLKRHELPPEVRAAMDVAEYGDPPEAIWQTPMYAARVLWRKHELRNELLEARVANRQDRVKMFEDALKVDDAPSVKMGMLLSAGAFVLVVFLAALPVAIRFIKLAIYG